jgi:hypothetical protein
MSYNPFKYIVFVYIIIKKNMRAFKSYPFLKLVNSYVIDAPVPSNLNYL